MTAVNVEELVGMFVDGVGVVGGGLNGGGLYIGLCSCSCSIVGGMRNNRGLSSTTSETGEPIPKMQTLKHSTPHTYIDIHIVKRMMQSGPRTKIINYFC